MTIESCAKGGHTISFTSEVGSRAWPEASIEVVAHAQRIGHQWTLSGSILEELDMSTNHTSFAGVALVQCRVRRAFRCVKRQANRRTVVRRGTREVGAARVAQRHTLLASMSHDFLVQLPAAPSLALLARVRAELAKLPIRVELPGELDLVNDSGWVPVAVHAIDHPALAGQADCPHWSGFEYSCGESEEGTGHHELVLTAKIMTGNLAPMVVASALAAAGGGVFVDTFSGLELAAASASDIVERLLAQPDEEFDADVGECPPFLGWDVPLDEPDDDDLE